MWGEYNFLVISAAVFGTYYASLLLVKNRSVTLMQHRRFWNMVLLISFLIAGPLGALMSLFIDSGIRIPYYADILWLHVEAGIVMVIVSIFHLLWHWQYYFKKKS